MRKGTFLLLIGVGIPVALLAGGWWLSSVREVEGRRREAMALLHRTAEVVRGVVDASLEEMRVREDARPFDAWNHVYNPPGVVALGDALALSPLARDPEDARVVGYFQIDAGGVVRTPYEKDPLARTHARARLVATRVEAPSFAELRAQVHGAPPKSTAAATTVVADATTPPTPEQPKSIAALNKLQNAVYEELQQADQDPEKRVELVFQEKKLPTTQRNDVAWTEGSRGAVKAEKKKAGTPVNSAPQLKAQAVAPVDPEKPSAVVDYTPFVFDSFGDELVLYRLVSLGHGSRSVQGALLDRAQIFDRWLPNVIERHSVASARPKVVKRGETASCALRTEASDILENVDLCFPPEALPSVEGVPTTQIALLFALLVVVAMAIIATDQAGRRADHLARQRGAFISAVSHELRTPLTTLRMHAELLRDGLVGADKRQKFHDDMVQESVRLSRLVENVLEATRLEEGRRPMRIQESDLAGAVRAIANAQAPFLGTKGFSIDLDVDEDLPASFDRQAIEQIVVNLLDNAVKYSAEASEKIVRVELHERGNDAVLRVLDRGPGIPSDDLERVFQRFYRVERPGQEHVVGTGLGLALVKELAQAHGGDARATTRDGGGCCIEVRIPRNAVV
jgi:signal transduction histidine kinase